MEVVTHALESTQRTQDRPAKPRWLTQTWLEPRLVVITALAIGLSLLSERLGLPGWFILAFNLVSYAAGGLFGAKTAVESLLRRRIDVDMLMILAALGAASVDQWHEGAILLFLFSLSNVLQDYAIGRSRQAIRSLFKLYPNEAKVRRDGRIDAVRLDDLRAGDVVLIEPGERIPVDGLVVSGRSSVDEAAITGESMPVDKLPGHKVFAGTLNVQGALDVQATQAATDTTLARIIKLVEEAQESKAPTERFLETFEQYYAMLILAGTALFILVPPALGLADFQSNFYRAMVLMTVASPCALVISTPAAFISAIASAARGGVLFKGGAYLELLAEVKAVAFDKTGTLTRGKPRVTDVVSCCELCEDELLSVAAAAEARSEHPLAKAVVTAAQERGLAVGEVEDFEAIPGLGVVSKVAGKLVRLGSVSYLEQEHRLPPNLVEARDRLEAQGKTLMGVVREGHCEGCGGCDYQSDGYDWMGLIALADQLRPEAAQVVADLKARGLEVVMLTGDNPRVADTIARQTGITRVCAGLMPEDKVKQVVALQEEFRTVAMVGDGVNDAPALAMASVGIAMGAAGTDVALETADLVLMGDRLELIDYAIGLSKKARRVVWQNISFSLLVIAGLVASAFAFGLALPLGVLGHEGSTVVVVANGLVTLLLWPEVQRRRRAQGAA